MMTSAPPSMASSSWSGTGPPSPPGPSSPGRRSPRAGAGDDNRRHRFITVSGSEGQFLSGPAEAPEARVIVARHLIGEIIRHPDQPAGGGRPSFRAMPPPTARVKLGITPGPECSFEEILRTGYRPPAAAISARRHPLEGGGKNRLHHHPVARRIQTRGASHHFAHHFVSQNCGIGRHIGLPAKGFGPFQEPQVRAAECARPGAQQHPIRPGGLNSISLQPEGRHRAKKSGPEAVQAFGQQVTDDGAIVKPALAMRFDPWGDRFHPK